MVGRTSGGRSSVPVGVRTAAAWSWRILLIAAVVYVLAQLAVKLGLLLVVLFGGLLLTALLRPAADWLVRRGLPRLAAAWLLVLTALAALAGLAWLIERRIRSQFGALRQSLAGGLERLRDLAVHRLGLDRERLDEIINSLVEVVLGAGSGGGSSAVVQTATMIVAVLGGIALAVFTAFWLVYDGRRVGRFVIGLLPDRVERTAAEAGRQAWHTLEGYLRGITIIALADAVGIGIALWLIGVPLPLTLAALTFLGGYVPLIGATVAGAAAVLVALAANGLTAALLTLGAVLVVQQIEGQFLQPIVMGRTLTLHPVAIAYALTAGGLLYGIAGAVLAVPLTAVVHTIARTVRTPTRR